MAKKRKETAIAVDTPLSIVPSGQLGKMILNESKKQLQEEMQQAALTQVKNDIKRRDSLMQQTRTIKNQIDHINERINAIDANMFTVNHGKIIFNDDRLNEDPAHRYPFHALDWTEVG